MNIGKFSVKRPVTVTMCALVLILFGFVSFTRMSVDLMPELELPMLLVMAPYEGAGPEEVETMVTKPIESSMASISGLDSISSISSAGNSIVMLMFDYGTNLDTATNAVRDALETAKIILPEEAHDITLLKLNMDSLPVMMLAVSGDRSLEDVKKIVDETIAPRLERIEGVAAATVMGGSDEQVIITADPYKLSAYGLSVGNISQVISGENANHPGGYITQGDRQILVRTLGQYQTLEELADTQVSLPSGGVVRLGDLVEIEIGSSDPSSIVTLNGESVVAISLQKESDGNTVDVDKEVRAALADLDETLFDDIDVTIAYSSADMIVNSVHNVERNLFLAVLISMLVIFIFLGSFRSTLINGVAIPLSLISTFVLLYFGGYTLNMVTLAALALSVGMVVDNSTVVLENIYRHRSMGKSKYQAAVEGTQEVLSAVVASTLTTVAVYLPFVFLNGITAQIVVPFAITLCFALVASLVVSVTVVPMLSSKLLVIYPHAEGQKPKGMARFRQWFDRQFARFVAWYQRVLVAALDHKKTALAAVSAALIASFCIAPFLGMELFPSQDAGQISVSIELPSNTVLEETEKIAKQVEEIVVAEPEVDLILNSVGSNGMVTAAESSSNTASLIVMLKPLSQRDRSSRDVAYDIQQQVRNIPGAEINANAVDMLSLSSGGSISIEVKGNNSEDLERLANSIEQMMYEVPGAINIENSTESTEEELDILIDREKAAYYNVSASAVYQTVALALNESSVSKYRGGEEELDIVLRYPPEMTKSLANLENLMVPSNSGGQVPLSEVATVQHGFGQRNISRQDQSRIATISCDAYGRDMGSVYNDIQSRLEKMPIPAGCTIEAGGEVASMLDMFSDLFLMIALALVLVYMVMACQFESLMLPVLIMVSVPVMFIGVFPGLLISGQTINMMSLLGVLMLEGIVVNNAIVLLDYVGQLRKRGYSKREALVEAGKTRMRPILVTTLTTVLAMIPQLVSGAEGAEIFRPMAATVIFGLTCSTIISLLVIPVLYEIMESWPGRVRRHIMKNNPQEEIDAAMLALEEGHWRDWEAMQASAEKEVLTEGQTENRSEPQAESQTEPQRE